MDNDFARPSMDSPITTSTKSSNVFRRKIRPKTSLRCRNVYLILRPSPGTCANIVLYKEGTL